MPILANRKSKINNGITARKFIKILKIFFKKYSLILLITFSLHLLYSSSKLNFSSTCLEIAGYFLSKGLSNYKRLLLHISLIKDKLYCLQDLKKENLNLRMQILTLEREKEYFKLLKYENDTLKKLLKLVENNSNKYITAKLLNISFNPFNKAALIDAGFKDGIKKDQVVTNEQGLIGRVIEVSNHYSKVMLINDCNSRVPVITQSSYERGILIGNGNTIVINYLREGHNILEGEQVITSGDGDLYPKGIIVGKVSYIDRTSSLAILTPSVDFYKIDFVIVYLSIEK